MVHILGVLLPDKLLTKRALTTFYGIGCHTAARICARFQIHDRAKMRDLSPVQITALAAFLSSPSSVPTLPTLPLASPSFVAPETTPPAPYLSHRQQAGIKKDLLKDLKIESQLRTQVRENIAHHRLIGSHVGRRHSMGLPVRGQNTRNNAKTAKKLNKIERKG